MHEELHSALVGLVESDREIDGVDRYMLGRLAKTAPDAWSDFYVESARRKVAKYGLAVSGNGRRSGFTGRIVGTVVELVSAGWPGQMAVDAVKEIPGATYRETPRKHWRVPSASAPKLLELATSGMIRFDEVTDRRLRKISQAQAAALDASAAFNSSFDVKGLGGELRGYQRAGVAYGDAHPHFINADDMGLGKTVMALALLRHRAAFPALIVCPASLKLQWEREARRWLPGLRALEVLSGKKPRTITPGTGVVIVNYDVLASWTPALRSYSPRGIVFDEFHRLKNPRAVRSKKALLLTGGPSPPDVIMGLTGTPVEQSPAELIHQLRVIRMLDAFGGFRGFTARYCEPGEWGGWGGAKNTDDLNRRLRSMCYIRRDKAQVLSELPGKMRVRVPIALSTEGRKSYDALVRETRRETAAAIRELQQAEEDGREPDKSARAAFMLAWGKLRRGLAEIKLDACVEWCRDAIDGGARPLIFAHYKGRCVVPLSTKLGVPAIYGDVPAAKRQEIVDRFEARQLPALVLNLEAGSVGLNLTSSADVVFVDLPLVPGVLNQAEDRAHRMGQTLKVTSWLLIADDTLDEALADALERKEATAGAITDGSERRQSIADDVWRALASGA